MAPAHNLLRRQYNSYGNCFSITNFEFHLNREKASLDQSSFMAEEEEGDDSFKGWLQLGIGIADPTASSSTTHENARVRSLMELNLFPERPQLPIMANTTTNPSSGHPLITQFGPPSTNLGQVFGPQTELGVISPPARAQTGLWFELKAAENQGKQPFLPQIPKSYLRIKDGRMTIRLLMKYLARKLELDDESQVEITCRGQQLHSLLTLQHIRDNIWCPMPTFTITPLNRAITTDRVMILHYSRRA